MQELKLITRLRRIQSELNLLGAQFEDGSQIYEPVSSSVAISSLMGSGELDSRVKNGLRESLRSELDAIRRMKLDYESRRRAVLTAIADAQQSLSESKGLRRQPLQDALLQLRSKQRLMNYEVDTFKGMHKQLLLVSRSRYSRALKLYKDIKGIDEKSAHLISFRWTRGTLHASSIGQDRGIGPAENWIDSSNEQRHLDGAKTHLAISIEQWLSAAIAATTPRGHCPNEPFEFTHSS
jgi:hypothetical protein